MPQKPSLSLLSFRLRAESRKKLTVYVAVEVFATHPVWASAYGGIADRRFNNVKARELPFTSYLNVSVRSLYLR